jgi:hypothetical protein
VRLHLHLVAYQLSEQQAKLLNEEVAELCYTVGYITNIVDVITLTVYCFVRYSRREPIVILCLEIDSSTKANLDELLKLGQYDDFSQAVCVAISNQLLLHQHARRAGGSFVVPSDDPAAKLPKKSDSALLPTRQNQLKIPRLFSTPACLPQECELAAIPGDAFVSGAVVPVDRWIFGQHNKLLPVKASCRALASMIADNRGIPLARAASETASQAAELGVYLREIDQKNGLSRDESFAVAFPVSDSDAGDKARLRYANQFVGAVNKQGQLSGLLADLKLISLVPGRDARIRLTQAGWEFAVLKNPVLDDISVSGLKFGNQEIAFLLDHIKSYVPAEDCAYRTVLKACAEGANTPNKLDDYLSKGVSPRDGSPFTNAFISTQRSGAISRMGDLGLVARKRDGIKVTYVTTETGHEYMTDSVARTA